MTAVMRAFQIQVPKSLHGNLLTPSLSSGSPNVPCPGHRRPHGEGFRFVHHGLVLQQLPWLHPDPKHKTTDSSEMQRGN